MLKDISLEAFAESVASERAVPGGGSVSALAGALAAALAAMVGRLTPKKEPFAHLADRMQALCEQAESLQTDLLTAVDQDADSYRQVLAAFRLPKATSEEKQTRSDAIQSAFKEAARVPLQVAATALKVLKLAAQAVADGNPDMVTDAAVGVMLARTAVLGAVYNVKINLNAIKEEAFREAYLGEAEALATAAVDEEQRILGQIQI